MLPPSTSPERARHRYPLLVTIFSSLFFSSFLLCFVLSGCATPSERLSGGALSHPLPLLLARTVYNGLLKYFHVVTRNVFCLHLPQYTAHPQSILCCTLCLLILSLMTSYRVFSKSESDENRIFTYSKITPDNNVGHSILVQYHWKNPHKRCFVVTSSNTHNCSLIIWTHVYHITLYLGG